VWLRQVVTRHPLGLDNRPRTIVGDSNPAAAAKARQERSAPPVGPAPTSGASLRWHYRPYLDRRDQHMPDIQPTAIYRTPLCIVCRQVSYIELPAHIAAALSAGAPVQTLLPGMPRPEREQLVSGNHPACWAIRFGAEAED
jgi:hypothetical protein